MSPELNQSWDGRNQRILACGSALHLLPKFLVSSLPSRTAFSWGYPGASKNQRGALVVWSGTPFIDRRVAVAACGAE